MYVAATGDKSMADNQILPEAGYPSDFDEYPDSLVGYTTLKDTDGGNDIMVGGWSMSGSDRGDAVDVYKRQIFTYILLYDKIL